MSIEVLLEEGNGEKEKRKKIALLLLTDAVFFFTFPLLLFFLCTGRFTDILSCCLAVGQQRAARACVVLLIAERVYRG
jgi:hypothetical protein